MFAKMQSKEKQEMQFTKTIALMRMGATIMLVGGSTIADDDGDDEQGHDRPHHHHHHLHCHQVALL